MILLKKILLTVFLLIIYRAGTMTIVPGMPAHDLYSYFGAAAAYSFETMRRFTLLGLGIDQYLSATVLILIASIFSKKLRKLLMGGDNQLRKFEMIIMLTTLVLLIVRVLALNMWMKSISFGNSISWTYGESLQNQILFITSKVCGGMVAIFIAKLITRIGLINGAAALICLNIFYNIKASVARYLSTETVLKPFERFDTFTAIIIIVVLITGIVFFVLAGRKVDIYHNDNGNNKIDHPFLFLRINTTGMLPLITALGLSSIVLVQIPQMSGMEFGYSIYLDYGISFLLCVVLTIVFAYMSFNPGNTLAILNRFNCNLGFDNKTHALSYLKKIYKPLAMVSVIIMSIMIFYPLLMGKLLNTEIILYFPYLLLTFL